MKPQWFDTSEIPYDAMWKEARIWFPFFLSGKKFQARFWFDHSDEISRNEITDAVEWKS